MDRAPLTQCAAPKPASSFEPPAGLLGAMVLAVLSVAGCAASGSFTRNDFGPSLPANASVEEVVKRVNANIELLQAWRSNDVRISGSGMPIHLGGTISVERPRNFRLTAGILGMEGEADFGSNSEWFWFWIKRGQSNGQPSYVYQARHDDVANAQMPQIPFQPDWLMEAVGVVPIDAQHVTLHPEPRGGIVNLISERLSPSGQTVKKVIRVDMHRGLVLSHSLHDVNGNLIARARLDNHQRDPSTKIVMPHLIVLEWPQAGPQADLQISLLIGQIDVNPTTIPARNWEVPKKPYSPPFDIGAWSRSHARQASATRVERNPVENSQANGRSNAAAPVAPPDGFGAPSPVPRTAIPTGGRSSVSDGNIDWEKPIEASSASSLGPPRAQNNPFDVSGPARPSVTAPASSSSTVTPTDEPFAAQEPASKSQPTTRSAASGNDPFDSLSR